MPESLTKAPGCSKHFTPPGATVFCIFIGVVVTERDAVKL